MYLLIDDYLIIKKLIDFYMIKKIISKFKLLIL